MNDIHCMLLKSKVIVLSLVRLADTILFTPLGTDMPCCKLLYYFLIYELPLDVCRFDLEYITSLK